MSDGATAHLWLRTVLPEKFQNGAALIPRDPCYVLSECRVDEQAPLASVGMGMHHWVLGALVDCIGVLKQRG